MWDRDSLMGSRVSERTEGIEVYDGPERMTEGGGWRAEGGAGEGGNECSEDLESREGRESGEERGWRLNVQVDVKWSVSEFHDAGSRKAGPQPGLKSPSQSRRSRPHASVESQQFRKRGGNYSSHWLLWGQINTWVAGAWGSNQGTQPGLPGTYWAPTGQLPG